MAARTRYEQAADRAVGWLAARLRDDGSYGPEVDDLACYYKSPYLFHLSGRTRDAARLLAFIRSRFMRPDHDFVTAADHKSDNAAFTEYWAYPNGWLTIAAQRMGRFDVAYPAFDYLRSCHEPAQGGFRTGGPAGSGERMLSPLRIWGWPVFTSGMCSEPKAPAAGWRGCWRSSRTCTLACSCALTAPESLFATSPQAKPRSLWCVRTSPTRRIS